MCWCWLDRLRSLVANAWGDRVVVVSSDMRVWKAPEKCDILVSELLGSFGDNELSPECLDGAQKFLKRTLIIFLEQRVVILEQLTKICDRLADGISIPASYTAS